MLGMGDDLVLARVSIDSSGVVRGIDQQERAILRGERSLRGLAAETTGMSGASVAAWALVGTAVAGVTGAIIRAQDNFGKFDKSAEAVQKSVFRLVGDVTGLNESLGSTAIILESIATSVDSLKASAATSPVGILWRAMWGMTTYGQIQAMLKETADIIAAGKPREAYGPGVPGSDQSVEGVLLPGASWNANPSGAMYGPPAPPFAQLVGAVGAQRVPEGPFGEDLEWLDETRQKIQALTGDVFDLRDAFVAMPEALANFRDGVEEPLAEVTDSFAILRENVQLTSEVLTGAMEASSAAVSAGAMSMSAAARLQEAILAAESIMKGKIELAEAVAAAARYDYKSAALHGVAAGLYFTAAAFHGVSAINPSAFGGGGSAREFSGRGPNLALAQQAAGPGAPNVTIIVQGSLLGTSEEQLARGIVRLYRKGTRDGA